MGTILATTMEAMEQDNLDTQAVGEIHEDNNSNITAKTALDATDQNPGGEPEDLEASLKEREEEAMQKLRAEKAEVEEELNKQHMDLLLELRDAYQENLAGIESHMAAMNKLFENFDRSMARYHDHFVAVTAGETFFAPVPHALNQQIDDLVAINEEEMDQLMREHNEATEIIEKRIQRLEEKQKVFETVKDRKLNEFNGREEKLREKFRREREQFRMTQRDNIHSSNRPTLTNTEDDDDDDATN